MGKSGTVSCFKFVGCGDPDSVDRDDLPAAEIKDSSDKRKWSFRKRSPSYRVLRNSVISETSLGNKASLDTATAVFQKQATCTDTDSKLSETISPSVETSAADVTHDESTVIIIQTAIRGSLAQKDLMKKKHIIMLQAAIRGHIVRKTAVGSLRCVQAIVKMQILIRERRARLLLEGSRLNGNDGKLDKQNSKGTEKRGSKQLVTYTSIEELLRNSFGRKLLDSNPRSKTINVKCEPLKSDSAWKWMERWMSIYSIGSNNSLGLEYTTENPDEKRLDKMEYHLDNGISQKDNCHSRETDSSNEESVAPSEGDENAISYGMHGFESNNGMGRPCPVTTCLENHYDDVSDSFPDQATEPNFASNGEPDSFTHPSEMECKQHTESSCASIMEPDSLTNQSDMGRPSPVTTCVENHYDDVSDSLPDQATESSFASDKEPDSFTNTSEMEYKQHTESSCASIAEPDSLTNQSDMGRPSPVSTCLENHYDDVSNSLPDQATESSFASDKEPGSFTKKSEMEYKQHTESSCASIAEPDSLTNQSDLSETTGKKVLFGSRRASNSAFIAAQSKFEELSLAANSAKPVGLLKQDASLELSSSEVSLVTDIRERKTIPAEASLIPAPEVDVVGSKSGTGLSVSSALDLPQGNVIGGASNVAKEIAVLEDKEDDYQKNHMNSIVDTEVDSPILEGDLSCSMSFQEDRHENIASDESKDDSSAMAVDSSQAYEKPESDESSGVKEVHMQNETSHPPSTLSPQASPKSHVTVPDSQETPSSHISKKPQKSSGKRVPDHKRKSVSSGNGYPSDSNHDSGARNGLEQLAKDKKTGKRRNSLGSTSTDHGNLELQESSSNSLPSYMQATESAKAKAIANSSPRSSPDVLDKDFHIKKRHSLPGVNTKHGSPRAKQSMSQALQDTKANGVHSPQERKWRR